MCQDFSPAVFHCQRKSTSTTIAFNASGKAVQKQQQQQRKQARANRSRIFRLLPRDGVCSAPRGQRQSSTNEAHKTKLTNQNVWLRFHPPTDVIVLTSPQGHPINCVFRRWAGGGGVIVCFSARLSHCLDLGANARRRWFSPDLLACFSRKCSSPRSATSPCGTAMCRCVYLARALVCVCVCVSCGDCVRVAQVETHELIC